MPKVKIQNFSQASRQITSWTSCMDQKKNTTELALVISRNTEHPSSEEIKRVDARLRRLHCNSGHCSNTTLADGLRRDGAPQWVCKRATLFTCDACEHRKPPQPRNRATFEYETKLWSQVGLDFVDLTLESHKTVSKVLVMVEAASQMAVTAVLFVRTNGEHRKCDSDRDDESVRKLCLSPYPILVAVRFDPEGCFCVT